MTIRRFKTPALALLLALSAFSGRAFAGDGSKPRKTNMSETQYRDAVVAVLHSLQSGERAAGERHLDASYLQHNLGVPSGRDGLLEALPMLQKAGTRADVRRILVDGDLVAVHSEYAFFGPKIGFDVFRFHNGKIVEHWDNLQETVTKTVSGHSMIDGPTEVVDLDKTIANKRVVERFVTDVLKDGKAELLPTYLSTQTYVQHNPGVGDGLDGLGRALGEMARKGVVMKYDKLHNVIGQGNFVLTMSEGQLAGKHVAFYDLFRVDRGKIVEHWDVIQEIPPREQWKNANGKF